MYGVVEVHSRNYKKNNFTNNQKEMDTHNIVIIGSCVLGIGIIAVLVYGSRSSSDPPEQALPVKASSKQSA